MLQEIAWPQHVGEHEIEVTASVGIANCPEHADNVIDLIRNADAAMYHAKRAGRNCHVFYAPEMNAAAVERLLLKSKLRRALGYQTGWLMSKLLDGDRPVSVTARIRSAGGRATVDLQRVEISGVAIDGGTLDFLIENVLLPLYPNAVLGRPFELGHRIEKLDVRPAAVAVLIGR